LRLQPSIAAVESVECNAGFAGQLAEIGRFAEPVRDRFSTASLTNRFPARLTMTLRGRVRSSRTLRLRGVPSVVDGAGHCPQIEQSAIVNALLLEFLLDAGATN
jgi:hypothetical protein